MASVVDTISNASKLVRQAIGSALSGVHAGDEKMISRQPSTSSASGLRMSSSVFLAGQPIPEKFTPQGENVSPDLSWAGVPTGAQELVLIVEDPDAPFPNPFVHWILHGLDPASTGLPAAVPNTAELSEHENAVQGKNDAKTIGWYGPKPPIGHGVHHYHFQLFALDVRLNAGSEATLDDLKKVMAGHVLGDAELVGTFARSASTK